MRARARLLGIAAAAASLGMADCRAQIRTDGSLGPAMAIPGPHFSIPETLGRRAGSNLFFSFGTFGIASGQSATFVTSTPGLSHVVSRVTGGSASVINGPLALQAAGATPAFIFINPAGVVFGRNATIDVPGAFHVATADYVRFRDGSFYADRNTGSTLSSAPPEAFGFLGTSRASIVLANGANLVTRPFQALGMAGGDIQMSGGRAAAPGGEVRVIAFGERRDEVPFSGALPRGEGDLMMFDRAQLSSPSVGDRDGGTVRVSAGDITIIDSEPSAFEPTGILSLAAYQTSSNGGDIVVNASGHVLLGPGGQISASADSSGRAGNVSVTASNITIDGVGPFDSGSGISSENRTLDGGAAGLVEVNVANTLNIMNGGRITADGRDGRVRVNSGEIVIAGNYFNGTGIGAETTGNGAAGSVEVRARGNITLVNGGGISSSTYDEFAAGNVTVAAEGDLELLNGGNIASNSYTHGNAGSIRVSANNIRIGGGSFILGPTGIGSDTRGATGDAGDVVVEARGRIDLTAGGQISSSTYGLDEASRTGGRGGTVRVRASELFIDGAGSDSTTGISSSSLFNAGDAGSVDVIVSGHIQIENSGLIASYTGSTGNAGLVRIRGGSMLVDSAGGIFTSATPDSTGNAGTIDIHVEGALSLLGGGTISSSTSGPGRGGSISVTARDVLIDGHFDEFASGINAAAFDGSSGRPGNVGVHATGSLTLSNLGFISIDNGAAVPDPQAISPTTIAVSAPVIRIESGGVVSAASQGNVGASNIAIDFGSLLSVRNEAGIVTFAEQGDGGHIRIRGNGALVMGPSSFVVSSVFGLAGNGGDIDVSARSLVMETAFIQANTAASDARGGDVTIAVDALVPSGGSLFRGGAEPYFFEPLYGFNVIQAAAPTGVSGAVEISSPVLDIASSITTFSTSLVESGGLARALCEASGGSVLAQTGRGGPAPSARGLLSVERPTAALAARAPVAFGKALASIACGR